MKAVAVVVAVAAVVCLALVPQGAQATHGVDVSQKAFENAWSCLKSNGYTFGIIRCFQSTGHPDPNCPHTIYNAWNGGADHVDIYMFPDPHAGNPESQVDAMVNYLAKFNIKPGNAKPGTYGMLWLDIEGRQYWSGNQGANRNFFNGLVSQAKKHGIKIGVYTSESQWSPIMGNWSGGSSFPLWYAHYDGRESFSDFRSFGGWSKPSIKQYRGDASVCGTGADLNWYP